MSNIEPSLNNNLELISKLVAFSSTVGMLTGGICVSAYSLSIGYFPQDISIGDGLLFFVAATCFGALYIFFAAMLLVLGIAISPIVKIIFNLVLKLINLFRVSQLNPVHDFPRFEWMPLIISPIAVLFIWILGGVDSFAIFNLFGVSITLYLFYSVYRSCGSKIKEIDLLSVAERENSIRAGDLKKLREERAMETLI